MTKKDDGLIKVKLSTGDRIHLRSILPSEGSFIAIDRADVIKGKIQPTDAQLEAIKYAEDPRTGFATWSAENDPEHGYSFTVLEHKQIVEVLEKLNKEEKLRSGTTVLYRKFVIPEA